MVITHQMTLCRTHRDVFLAHHPKKNKFTFLIIACFCNRSKSYLDVCEAWSHRRFRAAAKQLDD